MLTAEQYLAFVPALIEFQNAEAIKIFGWQPPLSANQLLSLSRSDTYRAARRRFIRNCGVITDKDCDELAFIAKHMDVWSAIGHLPRLRPLRTPKSIAKAIREHLKGPSVAVKTERTEIDVAQAELVEAMKRFRQAGGTPARLIVATQAAVGSDVGFMHAFAVRLVEEVRIQVNELIRNQKPWGELGGAFLKPMKTWKLLKQPAPIGA